MKLLWSCVLLTCLALAPAAAYAQAAVAPAKPAPQKDEPETVRLVLHPAPEPRPAMKYFLYPPFLDRYPGNAAVTYGKAAAGHAGFFADQKLWDKIVAWIDMPLEKLPKEEVRAALAKAPISFIDRAARRESIDWEMPIREEEDPFAILLPEVGEMRTFARMVALEVRLHVADGKFGEAVHDLQTGYAMARQVSQGPTLINSLVGFAISNMMCKQVEEFVQQPGAPNLYWALTNLPHPVADIRMGLAGEWSWMSLAFPELRDLDKKNLSVEQSRLLMEKVLAHLGKYDVGVVRVEPSRERVVATGLALWAYPRARQGLIERGYTAAQVEAMPVAKAVMLDTMQTYDEFRDEMFKWFSLPYPLAKPGIDAADHHLMRAEHQGAIPLAKMLLPAIGNAIFAQARHERAIAALRVVEAIRLYSAAHDGRLPERLDDITDVPVPPDPTTGKPFVYQRTGDRALLESPGGKAHGMRYEITFAHVGQVGNLPHPAPKGK